MRLVIIAAAVLTAVFASCSDEKADFSAVNLKCEYFYEPLGIDAVAPRFTWQMNDTRMGASQSAYRIIVGTDSSSVAHGEGDSWDTGKIRSDKNLLSYGGKKLQPFTKYYWSVDIWNENNQKSDSRPVTHFETGLISVDNWKGSWISDTRDIHHRPAPQFRKSLNIDGEVKSARIYIAAAGLYDLYVNGERSGAGIFEPAYTRFDRRTLYVTHDITRMLKSGENVIGVILGNGWYNHQSTAVWYFHEAPWRARPRFCLDLHVTLDNDSTIILSSGTDWKTATGSIIFNSIYTAEHHDKRLEQEGWKMPGFNDRAWKNAIAVPAPSQNITAQTMQPIRASRVLAPVSMARINKRTWIFDLGQNISGVSSLRVSGKPGTEIRMKHGERLGSDGRVDISNIDVHYRPQDDSDPFQTDIFILSGSGEEVFMPHFNYKGFQYVEVSSDSDLELTKESLTGYFIHSDVPPAGNINSSNPLMNGIWRATNNSYLSNLFGYPTDCPQREKNGWTGDAHIAIETGLYNFDAITVYEKWLADHLDEQQPNGVLPAIIPTSGWGYHWANGPDWTSTIAIIPWNIYLFYGDSRLLETCYDNIKRYVDCISETAPKGLTDWGLGDWIPVSSVSPRELTSTVYYYTDALILSKAARILGKPEDHGKYTTLADKIKTAFNEKYLDTLTAVYGKGLQTELSVPLQWNLVPEEMRDRVAANLASRVRNDGGRLDVGLLGTKAILNALSENGYANEAYQLASADTFPSWGWWIRNGATTLYENWPIDSDRDISMNHIMFGEIGAWMYKALGGINPDENEPGFKNIILRPCFVDRLDHFEAEHQGPYGKIISSWKRDGQYIDYKVVVPPNSTADLHLFCTELTVDGKDPAASGYIEIERAAKGSYSLSLKPGEYNFRFKCPAT